MHALQPKKLLIMNILDILKKYSDENHRLSQQQILEILERVYNIKADRKAIKRNLMALMDYGYEIEFSESVRVKKNGEEETIHSNWYLKREFEDSELRLLIDSLLFSKHIPHNQCRELIKKLKGLSSIYFGTKVNHICYMPDNNPQSAQLFYTIEILAEAIEKKCQVSFNYSYYDTDKKLHPRLNDEGEIRVYTVNPYQMVAANGRYYLVCNNDKYDNISNYRIDRISNIKLLESRLKSRDKVKGMEHGLDLPKHMAEHIYMFAGESVRVKFRARRYIVGEIIDWFGIDVTFANKENEKVDVTVKVNERAMLCWALQYGEHIEVLEPTELREKVKEKVLAIQEKYSKGE